MANVNNDVDNRTRLSLIQVGSFQDARQLFELPVAPRSGGTSMPEPTVIAEFPEGPVALADGSLLVVEMRGKKR
jgi:hypothetical protein